LARGQRRLLKIWLRHAENLNEPEEEVVHVCEPKSGKNISDDEEERLVSGLMNF
jgi:hypothetical protein